MVPRRKLQFATGEAERQARSAAAGRERRARQAKDQKASQTTARRLCRENSEVHAPENEAKILCFHARHGHEFYISNTLGFDTV